MGRDFNEIFVLLNNKIISSFAFPRMHSQYPIFILIISTILTSTLTLIIDGAVGTRVGYPALVMLMAMWVR